MKYYAVLWILFFGAVSLDVAAQDAAAQDAAAQDAAAQEETALVEKSPTPGDPDWFQEMLAREIAPLAPEQIKPEDESFKASIPARLLQPIEESGGVYSMALDFGPGPDAQVACYLYPNVMDLAASLLSYSHNTFSRIAQVYGGVESKMVYGIDAGGIASSPYMGVDWLYRTKPGESGVVAGQLKILIATKQERTLVCVGTFVGFDDSFFRLFLAFVGTLDIADAPVRNPYYKSLYLVKITEQVVGLAEFRHQIGEDGNIEVREDLSMLVPVSEQALKAQDTVSLEYADLKGNFLGKVKVKAENGQVQTQLNLSRGEETSWKASGLYQGEEFAAAIEGEPKSDLQRRQEFLEFAKTAEHGKSYVYLEWVPDMDPNVFSQQKIDYHGTYEEGFSVRLDAGPINYDALMDRDSSVLSMNANFDGTAFTLERIEQEGDVLFPLSLQEEDEP